MYSLRCRQLASKKIITKPFSLDHPSCIENRCGNISTLYVCKSDVVEGFAKYRTWKGKGNKIEPQKWQVQKSMPLLGRYTDTFVLYVLTFAKIILTTSNSPACAREKCTTCGQVAYWQDSQGKTFYGFITVWRHNCQNLCVQEGRTPRPDKNQTTMLSVPWFLHFS